MATPCIIRNFSFLVIFDNRSKALSSGESKVELLVPLVLVSPKVEWMDASTMIGKTTHGSLRGGHMSSGQRLRVLVAGVDGSSKIEVRTVKQ